MNKYISKLFFFVLVFSPLSFGARAQWSFGIVTAAVLSGFLLLLIHKRSCNEGLYEVPGTLPLFLFCLWILIQLVPLPPGLIKLISKNTYGFYQKTSGLISPGRWQTISINPHATMAEFFRYTTYAVFYLFMVQLLKDSRLLKKTLNVIAALAAIIAVFAVIQYVASKNLIYGIRTVPSNATPFGPYIYHNHFAGFMEMVFPVVLCLFLYYKPRLSDLPPRARLYEYLSHPKTNPHLIYGLCSILAGVSVFVSYSRGGIVSLCLSMVFMTVAMTMMDTRKKQGGFLVCLVILVILFSVGWFGWDFIFERFEEIRNSDGFIQDNRIPVWQDSIRIIRDFSLTGTGFGTFVDIYPGYRTVEGNLLFDHAHNDYLEFWACGGIVSVLLCAWFLFSVVYQTLQRVRKRRDNQAVFIYIGSITGIIAILIHSITDFNMQNGANGLYFFFLAGLCVSAANTRRKSINSDTFLRIWVPRKPGTVISVTAVLLLVTSTVNLAGVSAHYQFSKIQSISLHPDLPTQDLEDIGKTADRAARLDPLNAQYHYGVANIMLALKNVGRAVPYFKQAVLLNPAKGEYLQRLGFVLSETDNAIYIENLIKSGIQMDIISPDRYRDYADWLAEKGRIPESIVAFRQCMALAPWQANLDHCISLMQAHGFSEIDIYRSIPRKSRLYLLYGDYLARTNTPDQTENMYDKALSLVRREKDPLPWYFTKIGRYYLKIGKPDKALKVIQEGIVIFPENIHLRLMAGDLYKQSGIIYRAKEEYRSALIIDSGNQHALKRLSEMM